MRRTAHLGFAVGLLSAGLWLGAWAGAASAADLLNCSDFPSQAAAQANLRSNPSDPNHLDADNNGIACQVSPYPAGSATDFNPVNRSGVSPVVTTAPVALVPVATTSGDLQGTRIVSFSAGTVATTSTVRAASTLPRTGLDHVRQLVELALVFIGLGTALVIGRRPGVIR